MSVKLIPRNVMYNIADQLQLVHIQSFHTLLRKDLIIPKLKQFFVLNTCFDKTRNVNMDKKLVATDISIPHPHDQNQTKTIADDAKLLYQHAVKSVLPARIITSNIRLQTDHATGSFLVINSVFSRSGRQCETVTVQEKCASSQSSVNDNDDVKDAKRTHDSTITIPVNRNVYVVGFGKAVLGMGREMERILHDHLVSGVLSVPVGIQNTSAASSSSKLRVYEGAANNIPDDASHKTAQHIHALAESLGSGDLLIALISGHNNIPEDASHFTHNCPTHTLVDSLGSGNLLIALISGGGSALLPLPIPPITLADVGHMTRLLSQRGASIHELNTVRYHTEVLKGGGLAQTAYPTRVVSLILSDVIGDSLEIIASGPTVPPTSTSADCIDILRRYLSNAEIPSSVKSVLEMSDKGATTEENEITGQVTQVISGLALSDQTAFDHVTNIVIGSNKIAVETIVEKSRDLGYIPFVLSTILEGEARKVGRLFAYLIWFVTSVLNKMQHEKGATLAGQAVDHNENIENGKHKCFDLLDENIDRENQGLKSQLEQLTLQTEFNDLSKLLLENNMDSNLLDSLTHDIITAVKNKAGVCVISGGETTVKVCGTGKGGRNMELVLSAAIQLNKLMSNTDGSKHGIPVDATKYDIAFLSAGTDGIDGPTDAAGVIISNDFYEKATKQNVQPEEFLENNDSYGLFSAVDSGSHLFKPGHTGTNVMDIQILLISITHEAKVVFT